MISELIYENLLHPSLCVRNVKFVIRFKIRLRQAAVRNLYMPHSGMKSMFFFIQYGQSLHLCAGQSLISSFDDLLPSSLFGKSCYRVILRNIVKLLVDR